MTAPVPESRQDEQYHPEEEELAALRAKLAQLKKRRRLVAATRQEHTLLNQKLETHCHHLGHQQLRMASEYRGWKARHQQAESALEQSQRWNALNDGFFVWHQGPFATINGVRLGSEAVVSAREGGALKAAAEADAPTSGTSSMSIMGYLFSSSTAAASASSEATEASTSVTEPADANSPAAAASSSKSSSTPSTVTIKVPWTEINSALGQVVLLLKILEQTPHAGISFPRHVLVPQGSTSKIGLRQPNAITGKNRQGEVPIVALYHLYSDDSFALFGKRNFNLALRALTECLATAGACIQARDRTIVLPFTMQVEHDNPGAPCTIGGLPVQYPQQDGVPWTRVMKYLLTNVKWCVAYAAKHVDR